MRTPLLFSALVALAGTSLAGLAEAAEQVDYQRDIKPLLAHKCGACHSALKQEAGLRLDAGTLLRQGSDDGPVIIAGKASQSRLMERVSSADVDFRMPPEGAGEPLTASQLALLATWIDNGAKSPEGEVIPADPRDHWAYQPPTRSPLPQVDDPRWSHPIDTFIRGGHQRNGLQAVERADRYTLLRRVTMDLLGLPPTRAELHAFLNDESPEAWSRVVGSLLESPHYGERWGRHWMDVWRYSDWDGYKQQLRGSQRHIWRWRDWIVQSLNEDKGYDQMIVEMLAADEVAPDDPSALPATGFLARNFHTSNRNIWLDATVEHTAKAFLGLTLNCARCHDHKYDPVAQTAYYQFRAIFEPHKIRTDRLSGQPDLMKDGLPRAFDAQLDAPTFVFLQGNEKHPDKDHPVEAAVPAVLGGNFEVQPIQLPVSASYPALNEVIVEEQFSTARKQLMAAEKAIAAAGEQAEAESNKELLELRRVVAELGLRSLESRHAADVAKHSQIEPAASAEQLAELAKTAAKIERQRDARQAELTLAEKQQVYQSAQSSQEKAAPKKQAAIAKAKKELEAAQKNIKTTQESLQKTDGSYTPLGEEYPSTSSGRRLALARWITASSNPLTARVAVNHIWMRHFGQPLVDNVFDFGLRSPRPRHAELLDWLAVEFMEHGWSIKHLHRLIVTSRAWQLASSATGPHVQRNRSIDQDNLYLWRTNVNRLDAEIVRDNILAVGGQLDRSLGGADIDFRQGEETHRRSLYLRHAYEKQMTMLVLFDAASPNECYRRSESIIPQQALALTNSSLSLGQSRLLARQLWKEASSAVDAESHFTRLAFLQILSRPPAEEELAACLQFMVDQAKTLADTSRLTTFAGGSEPKIKPAAEPSERARENFVHVLMNHNDFVTIR